MGTLVAPGYIENARSDWNVPELCEGGVSKNPKVRATGTPCTRDEFVLLVVRKLEAHGEVLAAAKLPC